MAFGKKKEPREVEGYMKLTPKSFLIYLAIIVFCIIVIAPLVIVFSSSLRSPGNQALRKAEEETTVGRSELQKRRPVRHARLERRPRLGIESERRLGHEVRTRHNGLLLRIDNLDRTGESALRHRGYLFIRYVVPETAHRTSIQAKPPTGRFAKLPINHE
mgnify:CR=1 FL=1